MSVYNQKYFSDLESKQNVVLENLVYYRGETHYFVMTAKKQNLIANGVLKADFQQPQDLLARTNVEVKQLEDFVRRVAKHVGLPDTAKFADQGKYRIDILIKKKRQIKQIKYFRYIHLYIINNWLQHWRCRATNEI